jgi:hypothetical protein
MGDERGCVIAASVVNGFDMETEKNAGLSTRLSSLVFDASAPSTRVAASRSPNEK